jgi:hypothetical protein
MTYLFNFVLLFVYAIYAQSNYDFEGRSVPIQNNEIQYDWSAIGSFLRFYVLK